MVWSFVPLLLFHFPLAGAVTNQTASSSVAGKPPHIIFASDSDYPPFEWLDKTGKPQGFNVDLIQAIGKAMGYQVEVRLGSWPQVRDELERGGTVDVSDMFFTEERAKTVAFSAPFWEVHDEIFVRRVTRGINALDQLAGREVLCQRGSATADPLRRTVPAARLILVDSEPEALRRLASGQHDCAVATAMASRFVIRQNDLRNLTTTGPPLWPRNYCLVTGRNRTKLLADLNQGLAILKETGRFDEIYDKWFENVLPRKLWLNKFLAFLPWLALGLATLSAVVAAWIWGLRRTVQQRTQELSRSEQRLRLAVGAANVGLWDWDLQTDAIWFSPEWKRQLGYEDHEITNRFEEWQNRVHPDDLDHAFATLKTCRENSQSDYDIEFRLHHKDGSYRWILAKASLTRDAQGKPLRILGSHLDITERKQMEEVLRASEASLAAAQARAHLGSWELDLVTLKGPWSAEMSRLHYRDPSLGPPTFEEFLEMVHPEDRARVRDLHARVPAATGPIHYERRTNPALGPLRHLSITMQVLRDSAGRAVRLVGTTLDITGLKEAEQHIQQLNRTYEVLSDINQTIMREKDPQALLTVACQIAVEKGRFRMAWIGLVDTPGQTMKITAHAGATDDTLQILRSLVEDGKPNCAFTCQALHTGQHGICNHIAHDPQAESWRDAALQRDYHAVASLPLMAGETAIGTFNLYAGEPDFFDAEEMRLLDELAMDISFALEIGRRETERRKAEEELHWKTAFFEAQADSTVDGVLVVDNQGRKILQNQRLIELFKIPPLIAGNKDIATQVQYAANQTKNPRQFTERITHLYSHPEETSREVIELTDGVILDRSSLPVRDKAGKYYGRIWVFRDITQQRQLEEQFRQSQKMEAIGQLAGGVAHDFNNLLAAIMMQVELSAMVENLPGEVREGLQEIHVSAERAANLTRQLLAFSRRQVMQPRQLELNEIVTSLTKMLQRILGEDVRLQLNLYPRPLLTRADAGMLDQVLLNLVVNARDAMPGGGRLFIETGEKILTAEESALIPDTSPGRHVCLRVTDTGSGIAPEHLPRIFEPFFTTKEPGKGTGLGLATVFGIVKQHHGSITVESKVARGTTFQILLPEIKESARVPDEASAQPKPRGGTETILLVEDDTAVRLLTRTVLERAGYHVLEAPDGVQALRVSERYQGPIHLLLTDIVMPEGVSGFALSVRLQARNPALRVIFMSGYSAEIAGRELSLEEGQNFIQKPSSPRQLLETVRQCLDR
jgi:PAS domain S-box-containing protein